MNGLRRRLSAFALGLALASAAPALAEVTVDVDQGVTQPLPIAITTFAGGQGAQVQSVISNDLKSSGLFRPLDPASFPAGPQDVNSQPQFDAWKAISAQGLLTGQVTTDSDGHVRVDFRLWDVYAGDELLGLQFTSTAANWRRIAHKVADAVYEKLTGEQGYFDTRIVFVAESGPRAHRLRRLEIMDQDGFGPSFLTGADQEAYTPRFSANSQEVTYMGLKASGSTIYILNLETDRWEALGRFPGMVFAPRFSPDGRRVILSVSRDGNSDVYTLNLATKQIARLTSDPGIDTSPCYSPEGGQIVFNSDRGGSPQLYVMNADGSNPHRVSFGGGRYTTPVWSPDGKWIAFTKQEGSSFHIGVMKPDGSGERLLTSSYLDEGPTWAPNSRLIMFARDTGSGSHLWMVDVSGRMLQPAPYVLGASDPAWSSLLP
ncbi:MAG TPA: Tol-Pal system beta propeller repeat protein TolB [Caulobacteraceae bacterium]|nr:Tol-Pal system beta propeller repeat protein TolB [Caulobacteraceae bacterium]